MNDQKVLFVTTPVRTIPTTFPPITVLSIIQMLRKNEFDNFEFFNIDFHRPSMHQAVEYIISSKPTISCD